ncbi:hypothetical protein SPONN_2029 [uncultured Candidatus Thioglobus sp.]|nr:hypothetical protein SPONL_2241 [uncultured Candidatus Thioglobus sp.]SMN00904.1 hypothetical protein SPONN_2029 [uncultured Candidatus Thioglobus sp.]
MLNIQSNEIKTHFSSILRQVENGQDFLITKHKKVIAKLTPFSNDNQKISAKQAVAEMKTLKSLNIKLDKINQYKTTGRR